MPRRPRTNPRRAPSQKRAEDTVAVLLRATEIELSRRGFHDTTTNRIAEVAGVSIGTLYHYFPTKEALVQALVHHLWEREIATMEEREAELAGATIDAATRMLVDALLAGVARQQQLYRAWYGEALHLGREELGQELIGRAIAIAERALERRREDVRPENVRFAAELVVRVCVSIVRMAARRWPSETASGELARELAHLISRYLLREPAAMA